MISTAMTALLAMSAGDNNHGATVQKTVRVARTSVKSPKNSIIGKNLVEADTLKNIEVRNSRLKPFNAKRETAC